MAQFNTRIALKSDTEDKWKLIEATFIPLKGEIIIYDPDSNYNYSRAKIGDGQNTLQNLNFIDSGVIVQLASIANRPSIGSVDKLYIDKSTKKIYYYDAQSGYVQLANYSLSVSKLSSSSISNWNAGMITRLDIDNNILQITNGVAPTLNYINQLMVNDVTLTQI